MPRIDLSKVPQRKGSGYPSPYDAPCAERIRQHLGQAGGLTDFGVNLMHLPPGGWSSQRHWHSHEDEFVSVLSGELVLVEDAGETLLRAGDCAAFAKGSGDGHHLINRTDAMAVYLEVGSRSPDDLTTCSDIDMMSASRDGRFVRKDGRPIDGGQATPPPPFPGLTREPDRLGATDRAARGQPSVLGSRVEPENGNRSG